MNNAIHRPNVLWQGDPPTDTALFSEFLNRQLAVRFIKGNLGVSKCPRVRACVFAITPGKYFRLKEWVHQEVPVAINHGVKPYVFAKNDIDAKQCTEILKAFKLEDRVTVFTEQDFLSTAENIARIQPERESRNVTIAGHDVSNIDKLLLRRAFSDCKKIHLKRLEGGRAARSVFCVHAWRKAIDGGLRPMPFFAKIDDNGEIEKERQRYGEFATDLIPFYLRPSLDSSRCVCGLEHGILVGNMVEGAISLRKSLQQDNLQLPIYGLFEHTLKGLRQQAHEKCPHADYNLPDFLKRQAGVERIPDSRRKLMQEFGSHVTPEDVIKIIEDNGKIPIRLTPIHGDLHQENVLVRGGDAIVIDMSKMTLGPQSADAASLEVSLSFNTDQDEGDDTFENWKKLVDEIYPSNALPHPPAPQHEPSHLNWLRQSVRQIRTLATANTDDPNEYFFVLIAYLLRFTRLEADPKRTSKSKLVAEKRHAYSSIIAGNIAKTLEAKINDSRARK